MGGQKNKKNRGKKGGNNNNASPERQHAEEGAATPPATPHKEEVLVEEPVAVSTPRDIPQSDLAATAQTTAVDVDPTACDDVETAAPAVELAEVEAPKMEEEKKAVEEQDVREPEAKPEPKKNNKKDKKKQKQQEEKKSEEEDVPAKETPEAVAVPVKEEKVETKKAEEPEKPKKKPASTVPSIPAREEKSNSNTFIFAGVFALAILFFMFGGDTNTTKTKAQTTTHPSPVVQPPVVPVTTNAPVVTEAPVPVPVPTESPIPKGPIRFTIPSVVSAIKALFTGETAAATSTVEQLSAFPAAAIDETMPRQFNWAGAEALIADEDSSIESELALQKKIAGDWHYGVAVQLFQNGGSNHTCLLGAPADEQDTACNNVRERVQRTIAESNNWPKVTGVDLVAVRSEIPNVRLSAAGIKSSVPRACCLQDTYGALLKVDGTKTGDGSCTLRPLRLSTAKLLGCDVSAVFGADGKAVVAEIKAMQEILRATPVPPTPVPTTEAPKTAAPTEVNTTDANTTSVVTEAPTNATRHFNTTEADAPKFHTINRIVGSMGAIADPTSTAFPSFLGLTREAVRVADPVLAWDFSVWKDEQTTDAISEDELISAYWTEWIVAVADTTFATPVLKEVAEGATFTQRDVHGATTTAASSTDFVRPAWSKLQQLNHPAASTPIFAPTSGNVADVRDAMAQIIRIRAAEGASTFTPFVKAPIAPAFDQKKVKAVAAGVALIKEIELNATIAALKGDTNATENATRHFEANEADTVPTIEELTNDLIQTYLAAGADSLNPARWIGALKTLGVLGAQSFYTDVANVAAPTTTAEKLHQLVVGSTMAWQIAAPTYAQAATQAISKLVKDAAATVVDATTFTQLSDVYGLEKLATNVSANDAFVVARRTLVPGASADVTKFVISALNFAEKPTPITVKFTVGVNETVSTVVQARGEGSTFIFSTCTEATNADVLSTKTSLPEACKAELKDTPVLQEVKSIEKDSHPWYW